jgi:predicted HAD superfamily Cof-like phosphohydrolase
MKKQLKQVKAFHKMTENDWLEHPAIPSQERMNLRYKLIEEELDEFKLACLDKDLVESADALIDLAFVIFGSIGEFGLQGIAKDLFDEVTRSNMTKNCKTPMEAKATVDWYANPQIRNTCKADYRKAADGSYIVFNTETGKTLKSINYSPADLKSIITKAQQ